MPSTKSHPNAQPRRVVPLLAALLAALTLAMAAPAGTQEPGWPRTFESSNGIFTLYQPQPEDLVGDVLTARAAFSLQKDAGSVPTFGVLWFTGRLEIDRDSSTVTTFDFDVTRVRLPGITPAEARRYETVVEREATYWDMSGSIEELQAGLAATEKERASVAGLEHAPPRIVFHPRRAFLVVYDGEPELLPIYGTKLEGVGNTPYAVIHDPANREYYLSGGSLWYRAEDPLGPWSVDTHPPAEVVAVVPPDTTLVLASTGPAPEVLTATEPTELIATDGPPRYAPLVGDELLYVTNTESDVIREVSTQRIYVLLAGRWYHAASEDGPWTFVRGDQLPASFARVPPDSPKSHLRASVAGTDEAEDAVADAQIPQTSAIRRDDDSFRVSYDGEPRFEPIEGTGMSYAVNTDAEVIYADGRYYACDQGVWYIADDPEGPWRVSETRPTEIDDLPPDCPVYDVRYVYIYDVTPDVIYAGYLPGYFGSYPYYGTVVYGTGHHYRPWRGKHRFHPRRLTWGLHPRYNPWLSRWSFGMSYGSGFLRVGWRWQSRRGPERHRERPMWFGPGGYRRPLVGDDLTLLRVRPPGRARARLSDRSPANLYHRSSNIARVDTIAGRMPPRMGRAFGRASGLPNDVYAGRDGNVYRREPTGNWKMRDGRTWKPTRMPAQAPPKPAAPRGASEPRGQNDPPRTGTAPQPVTSEPLEPQVKAPERAARRPPAVQTPAPGDLERDFRARRRVAPAPAPEPTPARPAPAVEPAKPAPQERPAPQEKPAPQERPAPAPPSVEPVKPAPQEKPAPSSPPRIERPTRRGPGGK